MSLLAKPFSRAAQDTHWSPRKPYCVILTALYTPLVCLCMCVCVCVCVCVWCHQSQYLNMCKTHVCACVCVCTCVCVCVCVCVCLVSSISISKQNFWWRTKLLLWVATKLDCGFLIWYFQTSLPFTI
jgi:hypothetical protein